MKSIFHSLEPLTAKRFMICLSLIAGLCVCTACADEKKPTTPSTNSKKPHGKSRQLEYDIVQTTPHDPAAFTQGLLIHNGHYYESTGGYGTSSLRQVDPQSGKVLKQLKLRSRLFGEGLALHKDRLYQLEWQGRRGFIYDRETLKYLGDFRYQSEGWGLTWNGTHFILSDGTAFLHFHEPETFARVRSVKVQSRAGQALDQLNELEFVKGKVFANRWHHDEIVVIDPVSGTVEATLDLSTLERPRPRDPEAVLNGIAYDPKTDLLHVTGKRWPRIYVLRLKE